MNLLLAVGMALLAARALKTRIVFQSEQVVFDLGFSQQVVPRDEILGWRIASNQLYFEFRDRRKEALLVNWAARGDLRVRGWIAGTPRFDPDALLLDEAEGAVEDRQQALATARRLTLCLNVAAGILAVWMTAAGHPVAAVALVLMPVLALVLTAHSSGFIRFQKDYPNGLIAVGIACGVLPLRTSMATTAVDANGSWLFALIIGLVFSAAAARFTPLLTEYRPWDSDRPRGGSAVCVWCRDAGQPAARSVAGDHAQGAIAGTGCEGRQNHLLQTETGPLGRPARWEHGGSAEGELAGDQEGSYGLYPGACRRAWGSLVRSAADCGVPLATPEVRAYIAKLVS